MNRRTAKDMTAWIRQLEDLRETLMKLNAEEEMTLRESEMSKELLQSEKKHNVYRKQQLQKMKDFHTKEKEVVNCLSALQFCAKNGTLRRMQDFAVVTVNNYKRSIAVKKFTWAKKLGTAIEEYVKSRPLVMDLHYKVNFVELLEALLSAIMAEKNRFRKFKNDETQIGNILLKQTLTEIAEHVLRYYRVVNKVNKPKKRLVSSAHAKVMAKMAMNNRNKQKPSSSVPEPMLIDDGKKMMPETTVTSKCQDTIDTNEVGDGQEFKRGSRVRSAFRARKPDSNKSLRDDAKEDKFTPVQSKPAVPTPSSLKAPTNVKPKASKPKARNGSVRFENYPPPGSGFKKNFIEDHRVSSSGFNGIPNHFDDAIDPPADDNEIGLEIDPPLDGDEFSTPLEGNENDAPFDDNELDPLFGEYDDNMDLQMGPHGIERQMDDDEQNSIDDNISDWSSLDPSSRNKDSSPSKVSFDDLEDMTSDMGSFAGSHSKTKPWSNDNFGSRSGADGDFQLSDNEEFDFELFK